VLSLQKCWNSIKYSSPLCAGGYSSVPRCATLQVAHRALRFFRAHLQMAQTQFLDMCRTRHNSVGFGSSVLLKTRLLGRKQSSIISVAALWWQQVPAPPALGQSRGLGKLLLTKRAGSRLATATCSLAQINWSCWEAYIVYNAWTWWKWMALNAFSLWKPIVTTQVATFRLRVELQAGLLLSCPPPQYASLDCWSEILHQELSFDMHYSNVRLRSNSSAGRYSSPPLSAGIVSSPVTCCCWQCW